MEKQMPNRKKPEAEKQTRPLTINLTPALKAEVDAMAVGTGVDTSKRIRAFLESEVARWRSSADEEEPRLDG